MEYTEYDTRLAAYVVLVEERPGGPRILLALWNEGSVPSWTLPGGGVEIDESLTEAAVREVLEETGFHCRIGRALTTVSYRVTGREKTVQYFAAETVGGEFVANREVDRLEWVPLRAAAAQIGRAHV